MRRKSRTLGVHYIDISSEGTTTSYIKKMYNELHIIQAVEGNGKGKYAFIQE